MNFLKTTIVLFLTLISLKSYSQAACNTSAPFCASSAGANGVTFPAGVNNGSAAAGTDYGCLFSEPNPAWYYFQVSTSGSIVMSIAGSGGFDVDFVCWGPFTSQSAACGGLTNSCSPSCPTNVGMPGFYPSGNMADCSYSGSATETCTINNALAGQFYMMLITNFSNQPQNINFNQSGGTGATNCSILPSSSTHTICPAQTSTLVASSPLLGPTYSWNPGGATTQNIYVSPPATTVYSVTITGSITAGGTQTTVVNTSTVYVSPSPTVTLGSNAPVCSGNTLSLTATGGTTYSWYGPAGYTSTAQNPSITNVSASAAGIYTAVVTNAAGCSSTATINISLGSPISPTLTSNSPICAGGTLSLTATAATSYTWTGPGGYTSNVQNPVIPSVTVSGTYTLTSSGSLCTSISTISVTVVPMATVTLGSNSPICAGNALMLTATGAATSFTWTGPGGFTSNLQNPTIPALTSSGDYTLTTGTLNCPTVNTISVVVIQYTAVTIGSNSPICSGNTLSLTATGGAPSYAWTGPGGYTSNVQNPTITPILSSGVYTLITGAGGCSTTNTISITVIPAIAVNLNAIPTICNNASISLTAPSGGSTYNWMGPNNFVSNQQNPLILNASVINEGVYSVSITAAGCLNTGSVNVSVYNILSYVSTPTNTTLCSGNTVNLSALGTGGSGTYNYSWNPASYLSDPANANTVATGSLTTDYTITLSDANCPATQTVQAVVTVSVNPTPVITFGKNLRGCEPYSAPLESMSIPASASCSWVFSNNSAYGQCNSTGFLFPVHGVYDATLSVIDINGCPATATQTAYVVVDPKPLPDFSNLPTNPTVLINEVSFSDNSLVGLPMRGWHWDFGDYFVNQQNDTSNIQNPTHVYENAGTYTISLAITNNFGCRDTVTKLVIVEQEFALFIPNAFTPSKAEGRNDVFIPQGIGFLADSFEMSIYDRWGTLVYKTTDITKGWDGNIKGSGKLAEQGVYVYKIFVKDFKNRDKEFVGHVTLL